MRVPTALALTPALTTSSYRETLLTGPALNVAHVINFYEYSPSHYVAIIRHRLERQRSS